MTVIAWDGKTLAADKQATEGGLRQVTTKIMLVEKGKFKGHLLAGAGSSSQANMLMAWFVQGADAECFPKYQDTDDLSAALLVITPSREILRYDFNPIPVVFHDEKYALGTGREVAIGAMAMGATAVEAVEIASRLCSGCGMGIDSITMKKGKK
jgi:hypothetical protein